MTSSFDISPERRATQLQFIYRQLFVTPPPVLSKDVDLSGKTAIITGANVGLGYETARQILDLGGNVILAVRSESKGEAARNRLAEGGQVKTGSVQVWKLDLSSYDSIIAFANRARTLEHLDIAILNAGLYKLTETFDPKTGYEEAIQVNYLSNMLLTMLLLPIIKEKTIGSAPGHLCVISSDTAAWSKFEERSSKPLLSAFRKKMAKWDSGERYGTTKLLGQLFLTELAKKVSPSQVILNFSNPGMCGGSDLGREASGLVLFLYRVQCALLARTCSVGARSFVHAVTTLGEASHGQYIEDAKIQPMAAIAYKPEGLRLVEQLYNETLDEFEFAGVRNTIAGLSKLK